MKHIDLNITIGFCQPQELSEEDQTLLTAAQAQR